MTGEGRVSNSVLQSEIKGLGELISDVKKLLVGYEERIRCLERAGDSTRPMYEQRLELLEKTTKAHDDELKRLAMLINTQAQNIEKLKDLVDSMQRFWKWGLGVFTVVMTAVIIMLISGQAQVIFK